MTIKSRLRFSAFLLVVMVVCTTSVLYFGYRSVYHCVIISEGLDKETISLERLLRGLNEIIINEGTPNSINMAKKALHDFDAIHVHLLSVVKNSDVRAEMNHMLEELHDIKKRAEPFLVSHYLDMAADDILIEYGALITRTEHVINEASSLSESIKLELHNRAKMLIYGFLIVFLTGIAGIGFYLFKVYTSIMNPVNTLISIADGFNRDDLSIMMDESSSDEFGSLAAIFNSSVNKLNLSTQRVHERTVYLEQANKLLKVKTEEHKHAKEQIAIAKQDWEDTFNSLTDMITVHDSNYNIIQANKAAKEMLSLTDLNTNKTIKCFNAYHGIDHVPEGCLCCNCLQSGETVSFELFESHLDKTIHLTSIPKFNKNKQLIGVIHIARDITEHKASEEEKKKLENQLMQAQKMESIGNLAGGIAHDFNNIISVVTGYSELALKNITEDHELRDYLTTIHDAGDKAASLTGELLAFSRNQPLAMKVSNINTIIDKMTNILNRLIGENIELQIKNRDIISNVLCDKTQFEQVLLNLVVNARDALPNGGKVIIKTYSANIKKVIELRHENIDAGSYSVLSVKDTGTGISADVQEKMFDPFFSTKAVGKGTGMGLSTVYGIVKQHGGYITVHSKLGEGTEFKVYFPTTDKEVEEDKTISVGVSRGSETILAVDDESLLRDLVVEMLEPIGYNVLGASNGEEALQVCKNFNGRIDLLLTDVIMPGMNGKELADKFTANRPETKVVYMSGYTDHAIAHHGVLDEGVVLINKPLKSSVVANKIREVLDTAIYESNNQAVGEKLDAVNILLVDDNADIRKLVQVYMKDYGCTIDIAENGEIAVEKFKLGKYDVVLMDMQMPVMDGLTATKEIRKWEQENEADQTTIIALTGNAAQEEIDNCLKAGYSSHLAKPIKKDTLINVLTASIPLAEHDECTNAEEQEKRIVARVDTNLKDLIPEYLKERQSDINRLKEAIEKQDYETARTLGHTLKGSGGGFGFDPITDMGIHIEDAANEENYEDIEKYTNQLSEYIEHVEILYVE